jgi:hypothetical protein
MMDEGTTEAGQCGRKPRRAALFPQSKLCWQRLSPADEATLDVTGCYLTPNTLEQMRVRQDLS